MDKSATWVVGMLATLASLTTGSLVTYSKPEFKGCQKLLSHFTVYVSQDSPYDKTQNRSMEYPQPSQVAGVLNNGIE